MGCHILDTFFKLQRIYPTCKVKTYPNVADDVCDAQSARSDSCVSEEEYQEVYQFVKLKKKRYQSTSKKPKPRSNTLLHNIK